MNPLRSLAQVATGSLYVLSGAQAVQDPGFRAQLAGGFLESVRGVVPLPATNEQLVQANGVVQTLAGTTLSLGIMPRLSATALAASLVPTTLGGHAFWEIEDPVQRTMQQTQFVKNVSLLGGLLYIAASRR